MKSVALGMSGGVDSSVAAILLMEQGYKVTGVTFSLWDSRNAGYIERAAEVCKKLGIEHRILNMEELFIKEVVDKFCENYEQGETPNPCIACNEFIKLGAFSEYALKEGFDAFSTGHYAFCVQYPKSGRYTLKMASNRKKDQTYFMYRASQEALAHLVLPLGKYDKNTVRELAEKNNLITAKEKDSQDVCFIPNGDYSLFLESYTGKKLTKGNYIDKTGKILGTHEGIAHYTIGQRKGLGIALGKPAFVTSLDVIRNTVTLSTDERDLFYQEIKVNNIHWVAFEKKENEIRAQVKIRSSQIASPATIYVTSDQEARIIFDTPQRAPSKGQSAVFYDDDYLLGGGIIET